MKNTFLLLLGLVWFVNAATAQKIPVEKIPGPVMEAFKAMFPDATNTSWEMEEANTFEADFKTKGGNQSAVFDAEGKWMETETDMKVSELPKPVSQAMAREFPGFKAEEACMVNHAKYGICYEAEIEKGKESYEVLFNSKGDLLSKKVEKEEDKEEKDE